MRGRAAAAVWALIAVSSCSVVSAPSRAGAPAQPPVDFPLEKFIDDGMKYVDPYSGFYISPASELCFHMLPARVVTIYDFYNNWCVYPYAVASVELSSIGLTLWCAHDFPQCAHRADYPRLIATIPWIANSITVRAVPHPEERAALERLISRMGGYLRVAIP
jgi:hypothetical protein